MLNKELVYELVSPTPFYEYLLRTLVAGEVIAGTANTCSECPIAVYLRRGIHPEYDFDENVGDIAVTESEIDIYRPNGLDILYSLETPDWAEKFILAVDAYPEINPEYDDDGKIIKEVAVPIRECLDIMENILQELG